MPTIELSASGVSITRASPNSACRPSVARNTPPRGPTSSPRIEHPLVGGHAAACCVQRTVSTMFRSVPPSAAAAPVATARPASGRRHPAGRPRRRPQRLREHLRERHVGRRRGGRLGRLGGASSTSAFTSASIALLVGLGQEPLLDEVLLDAPQRVLLAPRLDLLRRAVGAVVVVGGVGEVAVGLALDERGPVAAAGVAHGGVHGGVHVERVVAVDDHAGEAVGVARGRRRRRPPTPAPSAPRWRSRCSRRRRPSGAGGCRRSSAPRGSRPWTAAPSPK